MSNTSASLSRALTVFLLSGFSALTFEVLWVRLASHSLGVTTWAVSVVVSTFMGGLALGGVLLGPTADRHPRPARLYSVMELGIGFSGLLASLLLARLPHWGLSFALQVCVIVLALLIPCTLMGGTLPALGRAMAGSAPTRALSGLYSANTAGAVLAAFLTDWVMVPQLGVTRTLGVVVVTSLLAAGLAWPITTAKLDPDVQASEKSWPGYYRVFGTYFFAGFASLGLQLVWTRLIMAMSRPSIYNFSTMLAVFLAGLALGSAFSAAWAARVKNPRAWFGATLVGISLSSLLCLLSIGVLDQIITANTGKLISHPMLASAIMCALRCIALFGLPTLGMGVAFTLAARLVSQDGKSIGTLIGRLTTSNTTGAILGSLTTAFVLLPLLGLFHSFLLLIVIEVLVALFLLQGNFRWIQGLSLLVFGALFLPRTTLLHSVYLPVWSVSWGLKPDSIQYFEDDSYATVAVGDTEKGRFLMVNSTRMMGDAPEGQRYAALMGHLPTLFHPDPKNALVICFGCGMTAGALNQQAELARVVCVELSQAVLDAGHLFAHSNGGVMDSDKMEFVVADGRNYLLRSDQRFDVITFEPPPPTQIGVVNLYSADYYQLCKDRLTENGVVCQWVPLLLLDEPDLRLVVKAFLEVFPNATLWEGSKDDYLLIGTKDDLKIDLPQLARRMEEPGLKAKLESIGIDSAEALLATYMHGPEFLREMTAETPVTTDDRPYLEYSTSVRVKWDPRWRNRNIDSLWGFTQNLSAESRDTIERQSAAWSRYRTLAPVQTVPGPAELILHLSQLRNALNSLGSNTYLDQTVTGFAAWAHQPDLQQLQEPAARFWAASLSGQSEEAEKTRQEFWDGLTPEQQSAIEDAIKSLRRT
ncbi:MAG: fused MFS/spermidine synthase [Vulcanimicrobiota bacterium]